MGWQDAPIVTDTPKNAWESAPIVNQPSPPSTQQQWQEEFNQKYKPTLKIGGGISREVGRGIAEYGGLAAGEALGGAAALSNPITAPFTPAAMAAGGGLGYAFGKQLADIGDYFSGFKHPQDVKIEDVPSNILNALQDVVHGIEISMAGQSVGEIINATAKKLAEYNIPTRVANFVRRHAPVMSEKGAQIKAGYKLGETTPTDPFSVAAEQQATAVEGAIPNLKFSRGQRYNQPTAIKTERATVRSPGDEGNVFTEQMAKNNTAIRNKWDKVNKGGDIEDLLSLAKDKQAIMDSKAAELAAAPTEQQTGGILQTEIKTAADEAKKLHTEAYLNIGNVPINVKPIQEVMGQIKKEITPMNSVNYPVATIGRMEELISSQNKLDEFAIKNYGMKWDDMAVKMREALLKNVPELQKASQGTEIGFQNWLDIKKSLSKDYWNAVTGIQPNNTLASKILEVRDGVTKALEISTKDTPSEGLYQKAENLFLDYAKTFYEGGIARVRQRGIEAGGLKLAAEDVPFQFATPSGADQLKKAIKPENAKIIMRNYFNSDLGNKLQADLSPVKVAKWVFNNRAILDKYGLKDEYTNLIKISGDYNAIEKLLGADVQSVIGAVLGSGKDIGINADKLVSLVKDNPAAKKGLQKGLGDFIINEIETTEKTRAGQFILSNAKVVTTLEKFKPAIDAIYKDNPEALKTLSVIQDAIQFMNNTAKSPIGGGSDTFELSTSKYAGLMRYIGNRFGAAAGGAMAGSFLGTIGAGTGAAVGMVGWDALSKYSEEKVAGFMMKAMFDKQYADMLIMMAKGAPAKYIESQVGKLMVGLGVYSYIKGKETLPPDITAYKQDLTKRKDPFNIRQEAQP